MHLPAYLPESIKQATTMFITASANQQQDGAYLGAWLLSRHGRIALFPLCIRRATAGGALQLFPHELQCVVDRRVRDPLLHARALQHELALDGRLQLRYKAHVWNRVRVNVLLLLLVRTRGAGTACWRGSDVMLHANAERSQTAFQSDASHLGGQAKVPADAARLLVGLQTLCGCQAVPKVGSNANTASRTQHVCCHC